MLIFVVGISILFEFSNAYVLLQVRKQNDNFSNIDALIHKVVPSDKFEKFAQKISRKQFSDKTTDVKEQSKEYKNKEENGGKEEISLSVDENSDPNLVKLVDLAIKQFTKEGPVLRTNTQDIKPKTIKFRTGESSVLYEINSKSLISGLEELLSSKLVRSYLDSLTRKAAFVYRAIKESNQ